MTSEIHRLGEMRYNRLVSGSVQEFPQDFFTVKTALSDNNI